MGSFFELEIYLVKWEKSYLRVNKVWLIKFVNVDEI